jgi:hypothetical protein
MLLESTTSVQMISCSGHPLNPDDAERGSIVGGILTMLPPLAMPDYSTMRSEAACGCTLVIGLTGGLSMMTTAALLPGFRVPDEGISAHKMVVLIMIYTEAAVAICCLMGALPQFQRL